MLDTPAKINRARVLTLRAALRLEILGMKRSVRPSAYAILKHELGLKGTRESVLAQTNDLLAKNSEPDHAA